MFVPVFLRGSSPTCARHHRRQDIKKLKEKEKEKEKLKRAAVCDQPKADEPPAKKLKEKDDAKPATKANLAAIVKRDENLEGPPWWHTKATEFKVTHCKNELRAYMQAKVDGKWRQFVEAACSRAFMLPCLIRMPHELGSHASFFVCTSSATTCSRTTTR